MAAVVGIVLGLLSAHLLLTTAAHLAPVTPDQQLTLVGVFIVTGMIGRFWVPLFSSKRKCTATLTLLTTPLRGTLFQKELELGMQSKVDHPPQISPFGFFSGFGTPHKLTTLTP